MGFHVLHRKNSKQRDFNRRSQWAKLERLNMMVQTGLIHDHTLKEIELYMWDVPRDVWFPVYSGKGLPKYGSKKGWQ